MCCFVCDCLSYLAQNGAKRGDLGLMGAICYLILYYNYKSILRFFIRVDTFFTRPESIEAIWAMGRISPLTERAALYLQNNFNKINIMCVQDFDFYTITLRSH